MAGRWFEAKRDGRCQHCKRPFVTGDEVFAPNAGVYLCNGCGILAENSPRTYGEIETAVMKELARLPLEAGEGALAQSMLYLARQLDLGDVSPRDTTNYTKEIRIGLLSLQDAYPPAGDEDETDIARQKRERRAREAGGY